MKTIALLVLLVTSPAAPTTTQYSGDTLPRDLQVEHQYVTRDFKVMSQCFRDPEGRGFYLVSECLAPRGWLTGGRGCSVAVGGSRSKIQGVHLAPVIQNVQATIVPVIRSGIENLSSAPPLHGFCFTRGRDWHANTFWVGAAAWVPFEEARRMARGNEEIVFQWEFCTEAMNPKTKRQAVTDVFDVRTLLDDIQKQEPLK
mgnify:CR=1 FL=1